MKTLAEILTEVQALATVTEDQFETSLAAVVTDVEALIAAGPVAPVAPTIVSVSNVISFSDGTTQNFPLAANSTTTGEQNTA